MNKLKSLIRGEMNINALSIISLLSFVVSCALFLFSAQKLYELKSEKRKILKQTKYFSERIPFVRNEIEAIKERLALKEQEAQKEQLAAQKEQDRKEKRAAALNEGKMSASKKYFAEHGITLEQAQLRASRRREIEEERKKEVQELAKLYLQLQFKHDYSSLTSKERTLLRNEMRRTEQKMLQLRRR